MLSAIGNHSLRNILPQLQDLSRTQSSSTCTIMPTISTPHPVLSGFWVLSRSLRASHPIPDALRAHFQVNVLFLAIVSFFDPPNIHTSSPSAMTTSYKASAHVSSTNTYPAGDMSGSAESVKSEIVVGWGGGMDDTMPLPPFGIKLSTHFLLSPIEEEDEVIVLPSTSDLDSVMDPDSLPSPRGETTEVFLLDPSPALVAEESSEPLSDMDGMLHPAASGPEAGDTVYFPPRTAVHDELGQLRDGDAGVGGRRTALGALAEKSEGIGAWYCPFIYSPQMGNERK